MGSYYFAYKLQRDGQRDIERQDRELEPLTASMQYGDDDGSFNSSRGASSFRSDHGGGGGGGSSSSHKGRMRNMHELNRA